MKSKKITLQDIADQAHVSKALVSRVINNRPVRVSEQKREQILRIANETDYVPTGKIMNYSSGIPKLNKTIALLLPHMQYKFMADLTETITHVAYENGYTVIAFDTQENNTLEMKYLEICNSVKVSGIIIDSFSSANNRKYIDKLTEWGIPFVFVDYYPNHVETPNYSIVSTKNEEGMFKLTESLIKRGHKKILSIIQDKSTLTNVSMCRINGYYAAMDKYGLPGFNQIIYPNRDYTQQPIYSLLNTSQKFNAFIIHTGSDMQPFCDLILATEYYKQTDFEIGVFDDFNISFLDQAKGIHRKTYQRISNIVSQRPQEIGQLAVNTLLENIQKGNQYVPIQSFIDCDLINIKE